MALKKQITDEKGIITRYHKIQSFETDRRTIMIQIRSFVTDALRQKELQAEQQNTDADTAAAGIAILQAQISGLMEQNTDGSKTDEIKDLTEQLNTQATNQDAPRYVPVNQLHASELEVKLEYFEPISLASLYQALATGTGDLAGATEV